MKIEMVQKFNELCRFNSKRFDTEYLVDCLQNGKDPNNNLISQLTPLNLKSKITNIFIVCPY